MLNGFFPRREVVFKMALVSFGLMSWLAGDNLQSIVLKPLEGPISLERNAKNGGIIWDIEGDVPNVLAKVNALNVDVFLEEMLKAQPTQDTGSGTSDFQVLSGPVSIGPSIEQEPTITFTPTSLNTSDAPDGEITLTNSTGTAFNFSLADVKNIWSALEPVLVADLTEVQLARLTGTPTPDVEDQEEDIPPDTVTEVPVTEVEPEVDPATAPQTGTALNLEATQSVVAGRVTTLTLGDDVTDIRVIDGPDHGNLTVNPDKSLALVLTGSDSEEDLQFTVEVQYADGSTDTVVKSLTVEAGTQGGGWGLGDFYTLETDASGELIVETGEDHRKVYVSGSDDALSRAEIAKLENVSIDEVNIKFFKTYLQYGATDGLAVDEEVGQLIWDGLTRYGDGDSSDWLLFERGHNYDEFTVRLGVGESALNPMYIGAYGQGTDPELGQDININAGGGEVATNVVVDSLDLTGGVKILTGENILFNDVSITNNGLNIQNINSFTLRGSDVTHVVDDSPTNADTWSPHQDRESGLFAKNIDGLLIEDTLFDHNGWADGYDYDLSAEFGQAPSLYSHNVYIQRDALDVTFRDNIVMRASADGAQIRSGGFVEDNIFIDNNNALLVANGYESGGNYSLVNGNVITSGAHKETAEGTGGLTQGISGQGLMSTYIDNIVTHLANPDDPAEKLAKTITHFAEIHRNGDPIYNDTIVYNWEGDAANRSVQNAEDTNVGDLDLDLLDKTTIQNLAAELLNTNTATIGDLAEYLAEEFGTAGSATSVTADDIIVYFRESFDVSTAEASTSGQYIRFVPNDLGDGVRWDNRLNWSTDSLPGASSALDSVDLAGNWVVYGGTAEVKSFSFGDGGQLTLTNGYLEVNGAVTAGASGATITTSNAGQFWLDGYSDSDLLSINAEGGRFVNEGLFTGSTEIVASQDAQVILATGGADFILTEDSALTVVGSTAKVGFDGAGSDPAVLLLAKGSDLTFTAEEGALGRIGAFQSGSYFAGDTTLKTGVYIDGADLHLDLEGLAGGDAYSSRLIQADEIVGQFDDLTVSGFNTSQDVTVTVDYTLDEVLVSISKFGTGSGKIILDTTGTEDDAQSSSDVWAALIDANQSAYGSDTLDL